MLARLGEIRFNEQTIGDRRQAADVRYRNPASPRLLRHSSLWHTSQLTIPAAPSPLITVNAASGDQTSGVASGSNPQASPSTSSPTAISSNDPRNPGDTRKRGHTLPPLRPQMIKSDNTEERTPSVNKESTGPNVHDTSEKIEVKDL